MRPTIRFLAPALFLSLFALTGCAATMENAVRNRAAFDLECPSDQLFIQGLGVRTIGARGCGKQATYITVGECSIPGTCIALLESQKDSVKR